MKKLISYKIRFGKYLQKYGHVFFTKIVESYHKNIYCSIDLELKPLPEGMEQVHVIYDKYLPLRFYISDSGSHHPKQPIFIAWQKVGKLERGQEAFVLEPKRLNMPGHDYVLKEIEIGENRIVKYKRLDTDTEDLEDRNLKLGLPIFHRDAHFLGLLNIKNQRIFTLAELHEDYKDDLESVLGFTKTKTINKETIQSTELWQDCFSKILSNQQCIEQFMLFLAILLCNADKGYKEKIQLGLMNQETKNITEYIELLFYPIEKQEEFVKLFKSKFITRFKYSWKTELVLALFHNSILVHKLRDKKFDRYEVEDITPKQTSIIDKGWLYDEWQQVKDASDFEVFKQSIKEKYQESFEDSRILEYVLLHLQDNTLFENDNLRNFLF